MTLKTNRTRIGYSEVMSTVGVFLALAGGAAFAAEKIGSKGIAKNAIKSKHIKNGQVKTADIGADLLASCARGTLAAAIEVDGTASFSSSYTNAGVTGFACAGQPQAKRVALGVYRICLPQVPGRITDLPIANSAHQAAITNGEDNFTTVRRLGTSSDCPGTQAEVRSVDEGGNDTLDLQDAEFAVQIAIG